MKKGTLWGILFLLLAFFTVWAVISNNNFSFAAFFQMLRSSSAQWMAAAVVCMLGFIIFEGMALQVILQAFGYKKGFGNGFLYSAADIYFSAITPSATGGQPASAFFMIKDGIPGAVVTISLVANLILYTLALLTVGLLSFAVKPAVFFRFHLPGRICILLGFLFLCALALFFYMLIARPHILEKTGSFFVNLGGKLRFVRHRKKKQEKLRLAMEEYRQCAALMAGHRALFAKAFLCNLLQRVSQITVTLFAYLAIGGTAKQAADVWFTQSFVTIGTYSFPIPGGMGVADYLLLDGFRSYLREADAASFELLSRGISFYVCLLVSALTVLVGMIFTLKRRNLT